MLSGDQRFDPLVILSALEREYVSFVLIGGLAQVLRGVDQTTMGVDISPSFARENTARLDRALRAINARTPDGQPFAVSEPALSATPVVVLDTDAGELKLVGAPAGVPNGYVDLRRGASKENLGHGVSPLVASSGDLAGMSAALGRGQDLARLRQLRRILELEVDRQATLAPPTAARGQSRQPTASRPPRVSR